MASESAIMAGNGRTILLQAELEAAAEHRDHRGSGDTDYRRAPTAAGYDR